MKPSPIANALPIALTPRPPLPSLGEGEQSVLFIGSPKLGGKEEIRGIESLSQTSSRFGRKGKSVWLPLPNLGEGWGEGNGQRVGDWRGLFRCWTFASSQSCSVFVLFGTLRNNPSACGVPKSRNDPFCQHLSLSRQLCRFPIKTM